MRIAKFLLGAAGALFLSAAVAQTTPTDEEIAKAKASATVTATQMRDIAVIRDSTGAAVLDSSGKAQTTAKSNATTSADLDYFKNLTGIDGLEQVASPGRDGKTGLVNVSTTQTFDLTCASNAAGSVGAAGGLAFKLLGCTGGRQPSSISFAICDAGLRLSQCTQSSDFSQNVIVPIGTYITVSGQQVGANCNSTGTCRVSVKGSQSLGGNDASLNQQAATKSANSSMVSDLRTNVENGTMAAKTTELGRPLVECAEKNRNSMSANGTVTGCGEEGAATVVKVDQSKTQSAAQCSGTRQCLRYGTTSQQFTRSCTRTFPITERITQYQVDTGVCQFKELTDKDGKVTTTNSCDATDIRQGKTKIGETSKVCDESDKDGVCVAKSWTEYWSQSDWQATSVSDSPSPVNGACDTSLSSETRFTTYTGGEWFGRLLSDSECMTQVIDEKNNGGTGLFYQLTYAEKAGCGVYTRPSVGMTCYGQPSAADDTDSCQSLDLNSCSLTSATPAAYTGGTSGLVMAQTETYTCNTSQKTCLEWSSGSDENSCLSTAEMTFGNDTQKTIAVDGKAMNEAMVAAAVADAHAEGVNNDGDPFVPLIFGGKDMRCSRATGGIGQLFGRNCCRQDLERPISGQLIRGGCNMDDVRLAAARRSNYTVYIGSYCSKRMRFPRKCLEETETYCAFNGILPRLIHEQGRGQLAAMAASSYGSDVVHQTLNFSYLDAGNGHWTSPISVNGVLVSAWQWPTYCSDPTKYGEFLAANPDAFECPGIVRSVIATCDNAGGCGNLPLSPEYGAAQWNLIDVDPLIRQTTAVSRYAVATGACSTVNSSCQYDVASWPMGQGGKAVVTRDIAWPIYSNEAPTETSAGLVSQMTNMADLMFRTWSAAGVSDGKSVPSTMRIDFSRDGGQSWQTVQVPTDLRQTEYTFPNSDTRMSGHCEPLTNLCSFRVTGTSVIMAKPWGGAENPECSGFTAGQLSAMDFGKMDLSEWLSSVMDKVSTAQPTELAKASAQQFQDFNSLYQSGSGVITVTTPVAANFARVTPAQGFGPFSVRLVVSGYWPQTTGDATRDTDRVTSVSVDWGDCTTVDTLQPISLEVVGSGYIGNHEFAAPDALRCGAKQANVTQQIKMTIYTTKSGVQTRYVKVENAWAKFPGGSSEANGLEGVKASAPVTTSSSLPPQP